MKANSELQLGDRLGADSAFKSVTKSAGNAEQLGAANADALVVDRSSQGRFRRRDVVASEAIDVLPPELRKHAKLHRAHIMKKMGVQSLADLVRAAERLGG